MRGFFNHCIFSPRIDVGGFNIYSGIFYYMALAKSEDLYLTMVSQSKKKFKSSQVITI